MAVVPTATAVVVEEEEERMPSWMTSDAGLVSRGAGVICECERETVEEDGDVADKEEEEGRARESKGVSGTAVVMMVVLGEIKDENGVGTTGVGTTVSLVHSHAEKNGGEEREAEENVERSTIFASAGERSQPSSISSSSSWCSCCCSGGGGGGGSDASADARPSLSTSSLSEVGEGDHSDSSSFSESSTINSSRAVGNTI